MVKVSVIIPNYNYARYLAARIDSVLQQTMQDIEVILLDDCSGDDSLSIMRQYAAKDKRIKAVLVNDKNSGSPFVQWKRGLALCEGEYVWIAESDDLCLPTFLHTAVDLLDAHPKAVYAMTASQMIDEDGKPIPKDYDHWKRRHIHPDTVSIYDGICFARQHQYWRNYVYNASGVVVRRTAITQKACEALSMCYSGDWLFWTEIALGGQVIEIHQRLNLFRFHTGSTTHTGAYKAFVEDVKVLHILQKRLSVPFYFRCWRRVKLLRRMRRMGFTPEQCRFLKRYILWNR